MDLRNTSTPFPKTMRNAENLLDLAIENGGGTIDRWTGEAQKFTEGYIVGGVSTTLVLDGDTQVNDFIYHVARFMDRQHSGVKFIGVWRDPDTDLVHVDAVEVIQNRVDAEILGIQRGEIAIWDCKNAEEIRLR